jgi:hypothetical protein
MMAGRQPKMRGHGMTIFEKLGQAQMLRYEGNQQLASMLKDAVQAQVRRIARLLSETWHHPSSEHPRR